MPRIPGTPFHDDTPPDPPQGGSALLPSRGQDCVAPGCVNAEYKNGLCMKDYSKAKKLVDTQHTTWEELERLGLARLEKDSFTTEFLKRKQADA